MHQIFPLALLSTLQMLIYFNSWLHYHDDSVQHASLRRQTSLIPPSRGHDLGRCKFPLSAS
jgi:hypothetical protein